MPNGMDIRFLDPRLNHEKEIRNDSFSRQSNFEMEQTNREENTRLILTDRLTHGPTSTGVFIGDGRKAKLPIESGKYKILFQENPIEIIVRKDITLSILNINK